MNTRRSLWNLIPPGFDWHETLVWYARAVRELQTRALDDRTSWRFLAAIHGVDDGVWRGFGFITPNDPIVPQSEQAKFWRQCQHQSWYFLPWHRGYVWAFERIVRATIVSMGGPADWALPYWNYNDPKNPRARTLPGCFTKPTMPDGSANPLLIRQRYGGDGYGRVDLDPRAITLDALKLSRFTGSSELGGPETRFSHRGTENGQLELRPHNTVHGLIGGVAAGRDRSNPLNLGLMSMPITAALDPIFWLHHANIDRLWEVWLHMRNGRNENPPKESPWSDGPLDRRFIVPLENRGEHAFVPDDMRDTLRLGYDYDDISDPFEGIDTLTERKMNFRGVDDTLPMFESLEDVMGRSPERELMGANDSALRLEGDGVETTVALDASTRKKFSDSFKSVRLFEASAREPDRVLLSLENIRGANDAHVFYVYVDLPDGADPNEHPERLAGPVSLFGVSQATDPDGEHAGNGLSVSLDITSIVDRMQLSEQTDFESLRVRFVPQGKFEPEEAISVERVSIYRLGE